MYYIKNFRKCLFIFILSVIYAQNEGWDIDTVNTSLLNFKVELLSEGYNIPWGMSILPDGDLLVTDISGKIYRVDKDGNGKVLIEGVPKVYFRGQGGLLDIEIHPEFKKNKLVYFSFSDIHKRSSFTSVASGILSHDKIDNINIIYKAPLQYYSNSPYHFGSRILLDKGYIYFSIGDRGKMDYAQDTLKPHGKIHRLFDNGLVPEENPFKNHNGSKSSVWSYGNRNPQGLAMDNKNNIWELEHGPKGGDELNRIKKGKNYGWPIITYGINYDGTIISDKTHHAGMEQPVWHWTPSIAVCGMKFYYGDMFELWDGNILVTSLKFEYLKRLIIKDNLVVDSEIIYKPGSRVRDVEIGKDGSIYVALENPGRIVRLSIISD